MYFTQAKTYFYHAKQKSINFLTCKICIFFLQVLPKFLFKTAGSDFFFAAFM